MPNMDKLRGKMAERRVPGRELSKLIGINYSTFYRKVQSGGSAFTVGEIGKIASALDMTNEEATQIFLS